VPRSKTHGQSRSARKPGEQGIVFVCKPVRRADDLPLKWSRMSLTVVDGRTRHQMISWLHSIVDRRYEKLEFKQISVNYLLNL
jgi:hypothetical protein